MSSNLTPAQQRQLTKLLKDMPPVYEIAPQEFAAFEKASKALATKVREQVEGKNVEIAKIPVAMQQVMITKMIEPFVFPTYVPYKYPTYVPFNVPAYVPHRIQFYVPQIAFRIDIQIPVETYRIIAKEALARVNKTL